MSAIASPALPRRLAALLYDTLLVLPLIMLNVAIALGIYSGVTATDNPAALNPHLVQLVAIITAVGFFTAFWCKSGQTLGMQAWRIKLVAFDGTSPGIRQAVIRGLAATLSAACLGLGYWWCLFDRNGRYWHDYLSKTELQLLPKGANVEQ